MQLSLKAGGGSFIDIGPAGISMSGASLVNINGGGAAASGSGCSPAPPNPPDPPEKPYLSIHMKNRTLHHTGLFTLLMLFIFNLAYAKNNASFDCGKAASATEKTICANDTLIQLDSHLGKAWKTLMLSFYDKKLNAILRREQSSWIESRDQCQNDADCIAKAYKQRLSQLGFAKDSRQFAGYYGIDGIGFVAIYPSGGGDYLIAIQTVDPKRAAWTCEVFGTGKADGKKLLITTDNDNTSFVATLTTPSSLTIAPDDATSKVSRSYCGVGGTIAFTYHREK